MKSSCVVYLFVCMVCADDPRGHLKPLGHHQDPVGEVEELEEFPTPWVFYDNYVSREGKLFILRGILNKGDMPAFTLWNDGYLSNKFGSEKVEVEQGKKEDRMKGELNEATFNDYLNSYNTSDVYLVHDAPVSMRKDLTLPVSLQCGGFQNQLNNIILWFSSGGTKSHLHHDNLDNINCLLDGEKYFFIVDKAHKDLIEANDFNEHQSFSNVDVERVDMYKFPKLRDVPWYEVRMRKGDCLFIPYKWYHHVDSKAGRNFAVNIWFHHLWWFNNTDCTTMKTTPKEQLKARPLTHYKKSSQFNMIWQEIFSALSEFTGSITKEDFRKALFSMGDNTNVGTTLANQMFGMVDSDHDGHLSWEEVYSVDVDELADRFPDVFDFPDDMNDSKAEKERDADITKRTDHTEL